MRSIDMQIRGVDVEARTLTGIVAPYNETTYQVPGGERIMRNAFNRSVQQRTNLIPLCVNHDHSTAVGMSTAWVNESDGLVGTFAFRDTELGLRALRDAQDNVFECLSVGFMPLEQIRARDGVIEILEGRLVEVSLVLAGAYDGARVLAVRAQNQLAELLKPFSNPPTIDLSPVVF